MYDSTNDHGSVLVTRWKNRRAGIGREHLGHSMPSTGTNESLIRERGDAMNRKEAERLIRQVEELPTLPAIITRILEVLEDESSSARDLERVVSCDQSIAARVLRIANSAYYGFSREITTIHRAIVILGFQTVRGLALGSSIFETFFGGERDSCFDRTAFWLHSIACSRCAMALGKQVRGIDPEEAFLGGLVHDIGMVVMDHVMHEKYRPILEQAVTQGEPLNQLERRTWGFDHADVGGWLAEHWKFPPSLLEAIRFHHRISRSVNAPPALVAVIHLADFCSHEAGMSVTGNRNGDDLQGEALRLARVDEGKLTALVDRIRDEREQIEAFFAAMSV
jgi:HD-like signal output (HDOD) protein